MAYPSNDGPDDFVGEQILAVIERYEALEQDAKQISEQKKEIMAEAKGNGYDVKILKKIVALRKRDRDDVAEEEAILDLYKTAIGMA